MTPGSIGLASVLRAEHGDLATVDAEHVLPKGETTLYGSEVYRLVTFALPDTLLT